MKIGIDIDDTLVNTNVVYEKIINKYNLNNYTDIEEFYREHGEEIYANSAIKPGAPEALRWMRENGCQIIIITAREFSDKLCMELFTSRLFEENNLPYDKIIVNSLPKGPDAHNEGIDLFIDDLESNLDNVSSYGIESIKVVEELTGNSKYKEFTNWFDILDYIKAKKEIS